MRDPKVKAERGDTWFIQLERGMLVIPVEVDEVTEKTCVLRQVADIGRPVPASALAHRFRITDITWLELVDRPERIFGPRPPLIFESLRPSEQQRIMRAAYATVDAAHIPELGGD